MDTMIEETPTPKKPAKKKAKVRAKPARAPRAAAPVVEKLPPADGIFTGLTVIDCCDGCDVDGCMISGKPYCAHPRKGGLHSAQQQEPAALKRMSQAKRILGKQLLAVRGE